ncbi:MAG TPA: transcriptional regulator [Nitrosopumilaceae archaeon]|nr:transcriptional regulator [Nitrosopumilaceae archaeon]
MSQTHKMHERVENPFLKDIIAHDSKTPNSDWITIQDPSYVKLIFNALGDRDTKNILNAVLDQPRIISEILQIAEMPQTSGYRKVNALIDNGLLIVQGYVTMFDRTRVKKYRSIFENVEINIEKNNIVIKILPSKKP